MAVLEGARSPRESTRALAASISRGDLDAAAHCFTKDACLLTQTRRRCGAGRRSSRSSAS
jgi:hypothetical protein